METLFNIFQIPIVVLNVFGFVISGVWLLVIGQWGSVVAGLVTAMFAPFLLGLAILPSMIFNGPTLYFAERRVTIGVYFFGFLSSVYIYTLIAAWCSAVTFYFLRDAPPHALWPLLIWSYGVATSPWSYMAQRDQSVASFYSVFFTQVAFIVMMVCMAFGVDLLDGLQVFALVMAVGVFFHMRLLAEAQRTRLLTNL
jgi:hypothetical protein